MPQALQSAARPVTASLPRVIHQHTICQARDASRPVLQALPGRTAIRDETPGSPRDRSSSWLSWPGGSVSTALVWTGHASSAEVYGVLCGGRNGAEQTPASGIDTRRAVMVVGVNTDTVRG